jgi:hypothetical protein
MPKTTNVPMETVSDMIEAAIQSWEQSFRDEFDATIGRLNNEIEAVKAENRELKQHFVQVKTETSSIKKLASRPPPLSTPDYGTKKSESLRASPPAKSDTASKKLAFTSNDNSDSDESDTSDDTGSYDEKNSIKQAADAVPKLSNRDSEETKLNFITRFENYLHAAKIGEQIEKLGKMPTNPSDDNYNSRLKEYNDRKALLISKPKRKRKLGHARVLLDARLNDDLGWLKNNLKRDDFMGAWEALQEITNQTGSQQQAEAASDEWTNLTYEHGSNECFFEFASKIESLQTKANELHGCVVINDTMSKSKLKNALKD